MPSKDASAAHIPLGICSNSTTTDLRANLDLVACKAAGPTTAFDEGPSPDQGGLERFSPCRASISYGTIRQARSNASAVRG